MVTPLSAAISRNRLRNSIGTRKLSETSRSPNRDVEFLSKFVSSRSEIDSPRVTLPG
jgi:ribosomal protein S18